MKTDKDSKYVIWFLIGLITLGLMLFCLKDCTPHPNPLIALLMYKPGTLVTLKDGKVYRTSKKIMWPCCKCMNFYASSYTPTPCSQTYSEPPFGYNKTWPNREECTKLYGNRQFPKLVTLCGK